MSNKSEINIQVQKQFQLTCSSSNIYKLIYKRIYFHITKLIIKQQILMACSKYQYVKKFEESKSVLLESYIVIRIDGRAFTNFCSIHNFDKPNDLRAVKLMNEAAMFVCDSFKDIFLAYGQSDQYSFAFNKNTTLFSRRTDKILSTIVSAFSSAYVFNWSKFFDLPLKSIPTFDSRVVVYPNQKCLKDYFRWRQVDCHINNLYNTVFWKMVKSGKTNTEVQSILKDTNSGQKNEILFNDFGINYNKLPQVEKKGNIICYKKIEEQADLIKQQESTSSRGQQTKTEVIQPQTIIKTQNTANQVKIEQIQQKQSKAIQKKQGKQAKTNNQAKTKTKYKIHIVHEDLIQQEFWNSIKFDK